MALIWPNMSFRSLILVRNDQKWSKMVNNHQESPKESKSKIFEKIDFILTNLDKIAKSSPSRRAPEILFSKISNFLNPNTLWQRHFYNRFWCYFGTFFMLNRSSNFYNKRVRVGPPCILWSIVWPRQYFYFCGRSYFWIIL